MTNVMGRILALGAMRGLVMAALTAPAVVGLSLLVIRSVETDRVPTVLATIAALGSAAAMVANPVFGWCADRWPGRDGSRRAWLVGGALVGLLGSVMVAFAGQAWLLAVGWMVAQAGYNSCFGALNGLVSTMLTPQWHRRAAGIFSASAYIGTLPGLLAATIYADNLTVMILVLPVVTLLVIAVCAPYLPAAGAQGANAATSASPTDPTRASAAWKRFITPGVIAVLRGRFAAVVALRLIIATELAAALTFGVLVAVERWSMSYGEAAAFAVTMSVVGTVGVVIASLLLALPWAKRVGERPWLMVALLGIAGSSVGRAFAMEVPSFMAAVFVGGLAIGCGMTATRSAAHGLLPPTESALGLGLLNVGNTLGAIVGPALAGFALTLGLFAGAPDVYVGMFVVLAVPALVFMPLVWWVRRRISPSDGTPPAEPALAKGHPDAAER